MKKEGKWLLGELKGKHIFLAAFLCWFIHILFVVLVPPYIGIANNGDFQKLSVTNGIDYGYYPWAPENYDDSFFHYITNDFVIADPVENGWHHVFSVFIQIAKWISGCDFNGAHFDIRWVGFVNALYYSVGVFILLKAISGIPSKLSYLAGLTALIILGDSYVLQYMNSFYTEIGTVSSLVIFWALMLYLAVKRFAVEGVIEKLLIIAGISWSSVFASISKQQDILTILPLVGVCIYISIKYLNCKKLFAVMWGGFIIAITVGLFNYGYNDYSGQVVVFNVTNKDVLSCSTHPESHLKKMGFDENEIKELLTGVGSSAYEGAGVASWEKYGYSFTRLDEVRIIIDEPLILARMMWRRGASLFQDDPMGNYLKASGALPDQKSVNNRIWSSLRTKIYPHHILFYLAIILIAIMVFFIKICKTKERYVKSLWALFLTLPVCNILRFVSVLLGDGSHDDRKHFFALNFEFDIIVVSLIILGINRLVHFMTGENEY